MKHKILCDSCYNAIKLEDNGFIMYQCKLKLSPNSTECYDEYIEI